MKDYPVKKYLIFFLSIGFGFNVMVMAAESKYLRIHGSNTVGANLAPELVNSWLSSKDYKIISDKITGKESVI